MAAARFFYPAGEARPPRVPPAPIKGGTGLTNRKILALDQGTTSSRAILFDRAGRIVGQLNQEFPQICPQLGWVEQDPEAI